MNNSKPALRLRIPHVFVTPWMKGKTLQDSLEQAASKAPANIQDKLLDALQLTENDIRNPLRAAYFAAAKAICRCKKNNLTSLFTQCQWEEIEIQIYVEKDIQQ